MIGEIMIPQKIHYCWFGRNPKPELAIKCIKSWKKYCPDYEIIEWNEDNFDISSCPLYVKIAYDMKKWAFVTDYVRLKVVYENGGIYLDTDVELLKPLDELLKYNLFLACEGISYVATGLGFGAKKGSSVLKDNMAIYEDMNPLNEKGEFISNPCPFYTTLVLKKRGIDFPIKKICNIDDDIVIFPNEYFNPYDWKKDKLKITKNTYSIHHYSSSWMTDEQKRNHIQKTKYENVKKIFGTKIAGIYDAAFWVQKKNGGPGMFSKIKKKLGW